MALDMNTDGQNQRQMEPFATEDNVKNGVQMSSIVSHDEDWGLLLKKKT